MDEIRVTAHELENILFGSGYALSDVTFDGDVQTITLHAGAEDRSIAPRPYQLRPH